MKKIVALVRRGHRKSCAGAGLVAIMALVGVACWYGRFDSLGPVVPDFSVAKSNQAPVLAAGDALPELAARVSETTTAAPSLIKTGEAIDVARAITQSFRGLRRNIFFDVEEFVAESLGMDDALVAHLGQWLQIPPLFEVVNPPPECLHAEALERMAALDLLENVVAVEVSAQSAREAREVLTSLATSPLPGRLPDASQKIVAGERYDAFVALARFAPDAALQALRDVAAAGGPHRFFLGAVHAGLVDAGTKREALADLTRTDQ